MENECPVFILDGYVMIRLNENYCYDIPLASCRDKKGLDMILEHLSEKTWANQKILNDVARAASLIWGRE